MLQYSSQGSDVSLDIEIDEEPYCSPEETNAEWNVPPGKPLPDFNISMLEAESAASTEESINANMDPINIFNEGSRNKKHLQHQNRRGIKRKRHYKNDRCNRHKIRKLNNHYSRRNDNSMRPNTQQSNGRPRRINRQNSNLRDWPSDIDALPPNEQAQYTEVMIKRTRRLAQRETNIYLCNNTVIDLTDDD